MSVNDRSIYYVKPPEGLVTKYYLMVSRGSPTPFGGGGSGQAVFAVDELRAVASAKENDVLGWQGVLSNGDIVCQFPTSSNYLMVDRSSVEVKSPLEVAREQKEEEEAMREAFPKEYAQAERDAAEPEHTVHTGQYA